MTENHVQAMLKQIEAGLLLAQSGACQLAQYEGKTTKDIDTKYNSMTAKIDSALRAERSLHRLIKAYNEGPQPKIGT